MSQKDTRAAIVDGIALSNENAPDYWKMRAQEAIAWCAKNYVFFTADDFWARLDELQVAPPPVKCANGVYFTKAKRDGMFEDSGRRQLSCRSCQHRWLIVWRSLIINSTPEMVDCGLFGLIERRRLRRGIKPHAGTRN
jgi:hypothetical protein